MPFLPLVASGILACVAPLEPVPLDPAHDWDGDGFDEEDGDCDDEDSGARPGGREICSDGVDQDCAGDDATCGIRGSEDLDALPIAWPAAGALWDVGDHDGRAGAEVLVGTPDGWRLLTADVDAFVELAALGSDPGTAATAADLDGVDGLDLALGVPDGGPIAPGRGVVVVVPGPVRTDADPYAFLAFPRLEGAYGDALGIALAPIDADGDRVLDLAVATGGESAEVVVFRGPIDHEVDLHATITEGPAAAGFGTDVDAADFDGDGISELVILSVGTAVVDWRAWVLPPQGLADGPVTALAGSEIRGGTMLPGTEPPRATVGDTDADGYLDLLVGLPDAIDATGSAGPAGQGTVWVVQGGGTASTDIGEAAELVVCGAETGDGLGSAIDVTNDLDGNGVPEIAIGVPGASGVVLLDGDVRGVVEVGAVMPYARLTGAPAARHGESVLATDVDGDGFDDLVVGSANALSLLRGAWGP